uniref:Uncharacterized protein n=1 Tax=Arundo donax TaxID=35708 RepID=A0A0A9ELB5_ARUDO
MSSYHCAFLCSQLGMYSMVPRLLLPF